MSTLEMSPVFAEQFLKRVVQIDSNFTINPVNMTPVPYLTAMMTSYQGTNYTSESAAIVIMSGTMPSDINTVTSFSAISPNILISFGAATSLKAGTLTGTDTATFNSTYVSAIATGNATWFLGYSRAFQPGIDLSNTIVQAFMGTVGVTGSGSDFEIPSTTVTSGIPYKLSNFAIKFPTLW